jgi:SAM-dependent methyltransferase
VRLIAAAVTAVLASAVLTAVDGVTYTTYADARPALEALHDVVPSDIAGSGAGNAEVRWSAWAARHDRAVRARLVAGDEDTIVNWLLFGTSFTRRPRAFLDVSSDHAQELSQLIAARGHELVAALVTASTDERRLFARAFFERKGFGLQNAAEQLRLEQYLLAAVVRVNSEQARFVDELQAIRRLGDQSEAFAARSTLFRERGLSADTSIQPSFALDQSLSELRKRGMLSAGAVRDVAVIGPGLDFSDKNSGYDFYPQQTLQPFALVDSLVRLGLADRPASVHLTTLDLSPRVNDHLTRARQRASAGSPYMLRVPIDTKVSWTPQFLSYWNGLGSRIGTIGEAPNPGAANVRVRTISVRPDVVSRLDVEDLNVVVQKFAERRFDLVVATNVFVYYDVFDQALALSNVAAILRPGGMLLSNNALIELPASRLRSVGYLTTQYSDRADDGDHVVWYRRSAEQQPGR